MASDGSIFCLFGSNVSYSLSPTIHNAGFQHYGLPYSYSLFDTPDLTGKQVQDDHNNVGEFLARNEFGGASVTVPHKLAIIPFLDEITPAAKAIGAVNTIVVDKHDDATKALDQQPEQSTTIIRTTSSSSSSGSDRGDDRRNNRKLLGDNTDWTGITNCILQNIPTTTTTNSSSNDNARKQEPAVVIKAGLVIGAGGAGRAAVYALAQLRTGVIFIYNRTRQKAEELKAEFDHVVRESRIVVVDSLDVTAWPWPTTTGADGGQLQQREVTVVIGNVPGDALSAHHVPGSLFANATGGGVLIEMAYKPDVTPLMQAAAASSSSSRSSAWQVVRGTDVLLEQGYKQFELWTGLPAPRDVMKAALQQEVVRRERAAS
ncbi:hypothetical protein V1514DRAFT_323976 [Lipomyces japonicus]|uniref:uncharacterized protein n=1 Tax=Lipomyces japonicus TaxID=56871 RepID=UPI0034CF546A